MRTFVIDLPIRVPTLNQWERMHWSVRRKFKRDLADLIHFLQRAPRTPMAHCRVTVERTSTIEPDEDNLDGSVKGLMDVLQPVSKRHPYGLGFIVDDNRKCVVERNVVHVKGKAERTLVTIEEIEPA